MTNRLIADLTTICQNGLIARQTNTQFAVAVHLLTLLASEPEHPRSSDEMAVSVRANPVYVRRVLGQLRTQGIVESRPGPHGGWQLRRNPTEVRLGEVWRSVNHDEHVLAIHGPNPDCPVGCRMTNALTDLDRRAAAALNAELDRTTIADLAAGDQPPRAAATA